MEQGAFYVGLAVPAAQMRLGYPVGCERSAAGSPGAWLACALPPDGFGALALPVLCRSLPAGLYVDPLALAVGFRCGMVYFSKA